VEQIRHLRSPALRWIAVAACMLTAMVFPATSGAAAEHILIPIVNEPSPWEFDDPCTGTAVHGIGTENGYVRITELGPQGHHVQVRVDGVVNLFDDEDEPVGTWTYRIRFGDQFPPDGQGAVSFQAVGLLAYANGSTAVITLHSHEVFDKGDVVKREFFKATCR